MLHYTYFARVVCVLKPNVLFLIFLNWMWFVPLRFIYKFTQLWLSGMAKGCRQGGQGFESQLVQEIFPSPKCPDLFWGPPIHLFSGHRGCFQGVKRPGPGVDRLSPSIARVKNEWRFTSAPCIRLRNMNRDSVHFLTFLQIALLYC